jgi:hypothetical protein
MTKQLNLTIRQGETFQRIIRWEMPPFVYKPITGITKAAPAVVTCPAHGLVNGWRVAVVSVNGMDEINAEHTPPRDTEMVQVTFVDSNTVSLNKVNSAKFSTYASGGYLQFYTPVDLTGYTARMGIKDRIGGTLLLTLSTGADTRIAIDPTAKTITVTISAADAAAIAWRKGVYDLEMVSAAGVVTTIFSGNVTVIPEVTT